MKIFRRIFRLALVPALLFVCSIHVSAASYYAATPEELLQIFSRAYGRNNIIYLTGDIDASGVYLQTRENVCYTVTSTNGSTLTDATVGGYGDVTVDVELPGSLTLEEFVTVTVNGDVGGFAGTLCEGHLTVKGDVKGGLNAEGTTVIAVEGDVYGVATVLREGSLTVLGDVNGELTADNTATVTVKGNVNGNVSGYRSAVVEIGGNVISDSKEKWTAVYAHKFAKIHVKGNVSGKGDGVSAQAGATVTVDGNVTAGNNFSYGDPDYLHGGTAVSASGASTVTIGGNAYGGYANAKINAIGGHGISAQSESGKSPAVTVKGNAVGGNACSVSGDPHCAQGGMGVSMSGGAVVSVGGHALGGTALGVDAVSGAGAYIGCEPGRAAGSLRVDGTVAGGQGDVYADDLRMEAQPDPAAEKQKAFYAPAVVVGAADSVRVSGFDSQTNRQIKANIVINIRQAEAYDNFTDGAVWRIKMAYSGTDLTLQAGDRTHIAAKVIEAARKKNLTLTVRWNGGADVVIGRGFAAKVSGSVSLTELAQKLNPELPGPVSRLNKPIIVAENHIY